MRAIQQLMGALCFSRRAAAGRPNPYAELMAEDVWGNLGAVCRLVGSLGVPFAGCVGLLRRMWRAVWACARLSAPMLLSAARLSAPMLLSAACAGLCGHAPGFQHQCCCQRSCLVLCRILERPALPRSPRLGAPVLHSVALLSHPLFVYYHTCNAARDFVRQCCVLLGQAQDSPLLVTVAAGAAALPTLLKLATVMGEQVRGSAGETWFCRFAMIERRCPHCSSWRRSWGSRCVDELGRSALCPIRAVVGSRSGGAAFHCIVSISQLHRTLPPTPARSLLPSWRGCQQLLAYLSLL